jgi:hypothetical protein
MPAVPLDHLAWEHRADMGRLRLRTGHWDALSAGFEEGNVRAGGNHKAPATTNACGDCLLAHTDWIDPAKPSGATVIVLPAWQTSSTAKLIATWSRRDSLPRRGNQTASRAREGGIRRTFTGALRQRNSCWTAGDPGGTHSGNLGQWLKRRYPQNDTQPRKEQSPPYLGQL